MYLKSFFIALIIITFPMIIIGEGTEAGNIATNFSLEDVDGNIVSLFDYDGYVIFINYFGII